MHHGSAYPQHPDVALLSSSSTVHQDDDGGQSGCHWTAQVCTQVTG